MPNRLIPYVKVLVHLACLLPFLWLVRWYRAGGVDTDPDPVATLTHFTGNWALWMLLVSLAVTPVRRLHPKLGNLIRFRRLLGLYAFFYANLHLATYVFLFSGYDIVTVIHEVKQFHFDVVWTKWLIVWPTVLADLQKRKFIQVGLFSWVILLLLALTSPNFMLRALGGKKWQALHRMVYVAAAAACFHYWWLVKVGVRTPLPDTLVLTVLLLARVVWTIWKRGKDKRLIEMRLAAAKAAGARG